MNTKFAIYLTIFLSLFILAHSMNPECADHIEKLYETLDELQYATYDQDILGVFRSLRLISKARNSIFNACGEEPSDFTNEGEFDMVQGCQESFEIVGDILDGITIEEESLKAIGKLERFYPFFQQTCLYADDYLVMSLSEEGNDEVMEALEELMQELLDQENRLVNEILSDIDDVKGKKLKGKVGLLLSVTN